jgi:hypothetical protein
MIVYYYRTSKGKVVSKKSDAMLIYVSMIITLSATTFDPPIKGRGIQHYVMKFVNYLRQVDGFLWVLWFPPPIKLTATI